MFSRNQKKEITQTFTTNVGQHLKNVLISQKHLPKAAHQLMVASCRASRTTLLDRVFFLRSFSIIKSELIQPMVPLLNEIEEYDLNQISEEDNLIISRRQLTVGLKFALDDLIVRKSCEEIIEFHLLQRNFPFLFYRFDETIRTTAKFRLHLTEDPLSSESFDLPIQMDDQTQQTVDFTDEDQTLALQNETDHDEQTDQSTRLAVRADDDESDLSDSRPLLKGKEPQTNEDQPSPEEDELPSTSDNSPLFNLENINVEEQRYFFSTVSVFSPSQTSRNGSPGPSTRFSPLGRYSPSVSETSLPTTIGKPEPESSDDLDNDSQFSDDNGYLIRDGQGKTRAAGILTSKQRQRLSPTGLRHYLEIVRPSRLPIVKAKLRAKRERDSNLSKSPSEPELVPDSSQESVTFKFEPPEDFHPPHFVEGCEFCESKRRMRAKLDPALRERMEANDLKLYTPGYYSRCRHFSK